MLISIRILHGIAFVAILFALIGAVDPAFAGPPTLLHMRRSRPDSRSRASHPCNRLWGLLAREAVAAQARPDVCKVLRIDTA